MLHKDSPLIIVGSSVPCVGSNLLVLVWPRNDLLPRLGDLAKTNPNMKK